MTHDTIDQVHKTKAKEQADFWAKESLEFRRCSEEYRERPYPISTGPLAFPRAQLIKTCVKYCRFVKAYHRHAFLGYEWGLELHYYKDDAALSKDRADLPDEEDPAVMFGVCRDQEAAEDLVKEINKVIEDRRSVKC